MARLDVRNPEKLGEATVGQLGDDGLWFTATGRAGHNRAMILVQWRPDVFTGSAAPFVGVRDAYGAGTKAYAQAARPTAVQGDGMLLPTALAQDPMLAIPFTTPPGADIGVAIAIATIAEPFVPFDRGMNALRVSWISWIEAE